MTSARTLLRRAAAPAAVAALALPASAQADCRRDVLRSWADDGVVQQWFPQACYRGAAQIAPADARQYTNLLAVLDRARRRDSARRLTVTVRLPRTARAGTRPVLRVAVNRPVRGMQVHLLRGPARRVILRLAVHGRLASKALPRVARGSHVLRVRRHWLLGTRRIAVTTSRPFVLRVRR